ncbi:hypothetical protein EI94DRAFT_1698715, partial [Lactarius quietus]
PSCLKALHSQNYIHQDVKPANFMTGIVSGLKNAVYLCCGCLPWQDIIKEGPVEQYEEAVVKMKTTLATGLCQGLPLPFITFTQHIRSLAFDEKPQYDYLHTLLTQCSACDSNNIISGIVTIPASLPKHPKHSVNIVLMSPFPVVNRWLGYSWLGLLEPRNTTSTNKLVGMMINIMDDAKLLYVSSAVGYLKSSETHDCP